MSRTDVTEPFTLEWQLPGAFCTPARLCPARPVAGALMRATHAEDAQPDSIRARRRDDALRIVVLKK